MSSLGLLCITRNQAGKLLRMLQSVKPFLDQMVVVDTGSRDLSPGVAKMQGAEVHTFAWSDSFSDALNFGIEKLRTDWILRLDTDEWLEDGAAQLRAATEGSPVGAYRLLRRDYFDEESYTEAWHLRLWRRDESLRFEGRIHEHFPPADVECVGEADLPVIIHHDGFIGGVPQEKHRRNLRLLELEIVDQPDDLYYQIELATTKQVLGDSSADAELHAIADRIMDDPSLLKVTPLTANALAGSLSAISRRELKSHRSERLLAFAAAHFGDAPPMLWALAQFEMRRLDHLAALRHLKSLKLLKEHGNYRREWLFDPEILSEKLDAALKGF